MPSRVTKYGSIASVTYSSRDVNGELTFGGDSGKTAMEQAFDKADSEKKKKRFSLEAPVEETDRLLALHNLSEEKLLRLVELGGIPMPSVAVVRASQGHDGFGDISLVLGRESIDPQGTAGAGCTVRTDGRPPSPIRNGRCVRRPRDCWQRIWIPCSMHRHCGRECWGERRNGLTAGKKKGMLKGKESGISWSLTALPREYRSGKIARTAPDYSGGFAANP